MKNFRISFLILFMICLIPVTTAHSQMSLGFDAEVSNEGLVFIEKLSDPQASAYLTIRNSNGELVGISHVNASKYLDSPILPLFLDAQKNIGNFSIENQNYEMKKVEMILPITEQHCLFDRELLPCYYYTFTTGLGITGTSDGEFFVTYGFSGLNHSYIAEDNDTIEVVWKILWPKN